MKMENELVEELLELMVELDEKSRVAFMSTVARKDRSILTIQPSTEYLFECILIADELSDFERSLLGERMKETFCPETGEEL